MGTNANVPAHVFVIMGALGDLSIRKLIPSLMRLWVRKGLKGRSVIIGCGQDAKIDDNAFRKMVKESLGSSGHLEVSEESINELFYYQHIDPSSLESYQALGTRIEQLEEQHSLPGNRAFYLAIPPSAFGPVCDNLAKVGLHKSTGWVRVVIEKPFGSDLDSARKLNGLLHKNYTEAQLYRIDHYLGKETAQNLLVFRFANALFESQWNREHIACMELTIAEDLGIEQRAGYYEQAGALRDMIQNHMTQLLTLLTMEVPASYSADAIRYEKTKVLTAISPIGGDDIVYGQYEPGLVAGKPVRGYRQEQGVDPASKVETFVAMRLNINNWRWEGVPFYLRTGKRMPKRLTQVAVTFRKPPVCLFQSLGVNEVHPNLLRMNLQPDEGFSLHFDIKRPGAPFTLQSLPLQFSYRDVFDDIPEAYETLILDVLMGDQTLFVHTQGVDASWKLYDPLLKGDLMVHPYVAGSWGPEEAEKLVKRDGNLWRAE